MPPFDVGDVVVCVDASPSRNLRLGNVHYVPLSRGSFYRVSAVFVAPNGAPVVLVNGRSAHTIDGRPGQRTGWAVDRFRKIDADTTEEFREQMRSLGKARERSDA